MTFASSSSSSFTPPLTPDPSHEPPAAKQAGFVYSPPSSILETPLAFPSSSRSQAASSSTPFVPSSGKSSISLNRRGRADSRTSSSALSIALRSSLDSTLLTPPPSPPCVRSTPRSGSSRVTPSHPDSDFTSTSLPSCMSAAISQDEDEDSCPICLEALSLRLAGEKPHVVPVCGHQLHHSCFEAVYGDVRRERTKLSSSLGLCGVCRREMKIGDPGDNPKKGGNKFAKLSGAPGSSNGPSSASFKMRSSTRGTLFDDDEPPRDGIQDDDLVSLPPPTPDLHPPRSAGFRSSSHSNGSTVTGSSNTHRGSVGTYLGAGSTISGGSNRMSGTSDRSRAAQEIVKPIVTVRAEHQSVERSYEAKKQHLTCMITIEMPPRHPPPVQLTHLDNPPLLDPSGRAPPPSQLALARSPSVGSGPASIHSLARSGSPTSMQSGYAFGSTQSVPSSQFAGVVEDLQARMADWKGHTLGEFGALKLYDHIQVRKDTATREFSVYLFEEAILCVTDDKRKGLGRFVDSVSGPSNEKLRLKGRVYLRHVSKVIDTSVGDDLSLTISMSDDAVAEFVMKFEERTSLSVWRTEIERLLQAHSPVGSFATGQTGPAGRIKSDTSSGETHLTTSGFSGYTRTTSSSLPSGAVIHEEDEMTDTFAAFAVANARDYPMSSQASSVGSFVPPPPRLQLANVLSTPRSFTPLDLMLILSVPTAGPAALKTGIIKNALEFIVGHVGPRTRLSIITFSAGEGTRGVLRKTPFIAVGKADGRKRLEQVVEELGCDTEDLTSMVEHKEERVNVVTACNLALDIVLQRKAKSALTGMILLNDGRDGAQKQQMDLVMARAEAAAVPIHAFGYGRSHDPSSLWLLSNHSAGSYTFVKDFYDLRDALAGCIGGILSIAATNVRLHIKVPETRWFKIRKVSGTPGAIVSRTGTDVDVELGELRFGERKDLVVEVEMSLGGYGEEAFGQQQRRQHQGLNEYASATDAFFLQNAGINPSTLDEYNNDDDLYDSMPDEAPLFEVNAGYRDPAAGKSVSRLNHSPTLLTITVNPPSPSHIRQSPSTSAPEIVRRRMELLVSDMLSRALLLMTRRNDAQAAKLLGDTKRIITTIAGTLNPSTTQAAQMARSQGRRSSAVLASTTITQKTLAALAEDVDAVHEACLQRELFEKEGRYLAAQQAVVLRDQRAWTPRSATERLFFRSDNALFLYAQSTQFTSTQ